jgi:hypothetical protein
MREILIKAKTIHTRGRDRAVSPLFIPFARMARAREGDSDPTGFTLAFVVLMATAPAR